MTAAAGGEGQVRVVNGEERIYPKSERHFKQMQEVYAPAVRAEQEYAEAIGAGWQTERYKMPNGEIRDLPAGSGDVNPALRPAPRMRGKRVGVIRGNEYVRLQ